MLLWKCVCRVRPVKRKKECKWWECQGARRASDSGRKENEETWQLKKMWGSGTVTQTGAGCQSVCGNRGEKTEKEALKHGQDVAVCTKAPPGWRTTHYSCSSWPPGCSSARQSVRSAPVKTWLLVTVCRGSSVTASFSLSEGKRRS